MPEFDLSDTHAAAFCPACGAGYTAGRTSCADCDRELLPRSEVEARLAAADEALESPNPPVRDEGLDESAVRPRDFDLSDPDAVAFCPSCGSGYRAGPSRCTDCDSELVPRSWVEARANECDLEGESDEGPVPLSEIENSYRAHVLGSLLNDERIWFATETSRWGAVRFLVLARDLDAAREVLSDVEHLPDSPPEIPDEG